MGETLTMKRILVADHSEIANRMFCAGLSKYGFLSALCLQQKN